MNSLTPLRRVRAWLGMATLAFFTLAAGSAHAQEDPPGRVGRLAELQGSVSWFDHEEGQWSEAERNRPLTGGDRLSTGPQARAELRVGSTVLRLAAASELEVVRLDDSHMVFQLHTGSLAVRVRSREVADELEVVTTEVRLRPLRSGHYRIDRIDDTTQVGAWRGSLRIDDAEGFIVETGQRVELWREGRQDRRLRFAWGSLPNDNFAEWVARDEQRDERSASSRYVSPEMTGAEDLDRYGRWEQHPEYGPMWFPLEVRAGWAPYREGRWAWIRPWGWTWVDEAPWGFAPFHYGRWVSWRGRWAWAPGGYVARPVYSPALVAWVGGPGLSVSINIGGPSIGWVPLAPRDRFVPHYRHSPGYIERVNPRLPGRSYPPQVPTGPVMYGNQGVPNAVTVVPRDVLVNRQPVGRSIIEPGSRGPDRGREPLVGVVPPEREPGRMPGPRLQPLPRADANDRNDKPEGRERPGRSERDGRETREGRDNRDNREPGNGRRPDMQIPAPVVMPQRPRMEPQAPAQAPVQAPIQTPGPVTTLPPRADRERERPAPPVGPSNRPPSPGAAAPVATPAASPPPPQPAAAPRPMPQPAAERAREREAERAEDQRKRAPDTPRTANPREREKER
jgi:FecR protein